MGRKEDPFWTHVEKLENGRFKCNFCMDVYAGGISRIKSHLSGNEGRGIKICEKVPVDVERLAREEIAGANHRKRKFRSEGANDMDATANSTPEKDSGVENRVGDVEWQHIVVPRMQQDLGTEGNQVGNVTGIGENGNGDCEEPRPLTEAGRRAEEILFSSRENYGFGESQINDKMYNFARVLASDESSAFAEAIEGQNDEVNRKKWPLERVPNEAGMVPGDRLELKFGEHIVEAVVSRLTTPDEPEPIAHQKTSGVTLVTTNLIGETFHKNRQDIWNWLMKASVFTIGIWGMGGVGKTELAKHINNQLLKTSNPFRFVYWVEVSRDCSNYRLQTLVAEAANIDLLNKHDQSIRAAILCKGLTEKRNSVLILDDLWRSFDVNRVGIPVGEHGCKLILTSRSYEVCRQMNEAGTFINVVCLSPNEAWKMFWEIRGRNVADPLEIALVAKDIVTECAGLPLALETMARTLKGVDDLCDWMYEFEALKESEAVEGDLEEKVFRILRFSYNCLSSKLQRCFLCCASFPEGHCIERTKLIEHLIAEKIIEGSRSRTAEHFHCHSLPIKLENAEHFPGHSLLNKLENACLLEGSTDDKKRYVKMHPLVRDMAVQILRANSKARVEAEKRRRYSNSQVISGGAVVQFGPPEEEFCRLVEVTKDLRHAKYTSPAPDGGLETLRCSPVDHKFN